MTNRQKRIEDRLLFSFSPERLNIVDESHQHAGHAGANPAGESHYFVEIVSDAFKGKSRVEAHRMVNTALDEEFESGLHALRLKVSAS